MTAADLLRRANEKGLTVSVRGVDRIVVRGRADAVEELKPEFTAFKAEVIEALRRVLNEADAIVSAARLLRECKFLAQPPVCGFLIGRPGEECRRCGASWREHYPPSDGTSPS
jgi:hypothetical protein